MSRLLKNISSLLSWAWLLVVGLLLCFLLTDGVGEAEDKPTVSKKDRVPGVLVEKDPWDDIHRKLFKPSFFSDTIKYSKLHIRVFREVISWYR